MSNRLVRPTRFVPGFGWVTSNTTKNASAGQPFWLVLLSFCNTDGVSVIFLSGPLGAGKTSVAKGTIVAASGAALLHRRRQVLVVHQQRWRTRIAGQFSGAGELDDSASGCVRSCWLPSTSRLLDTT